MNVWFHNKNNEPYLKFWNDLGLLEGINEPEIRDICALSFERMAQYIINEQPIPYNALGFDMSTPLFPIIRRVVTDNKVRQPLTDPEAFYNFCIDYVRDKADHFQKVIEIHPHIDIEAQICLEISEEAVRIISESE